MTIQVHQDQYHDVNMKVILNISRSANHSFIYTDRHKHECQWVCEHKKEVPDQMKHTKIVYISIHTLSRDIHFQINMWIILQATMSAAVPEGSKYCT